MTIFYLGLNPRYQWFRWLPDGINVMYSAGGFWNGLQWRRRGWLAQTGRKWLDCGGFTLLNQYGDYPFSWGAYLNLVAMLRPDYYATLDYPCEPDISRSLGQLTNAERLRATVENAQIMLEHEQMVGVGTMVPVIQGYTLDEYRQCLDLHQQAGTIRSYMAVGSMCRRVSNDELERLVIGIYEHARQAGVQRLHYFGLKLSPHLQDLSDYIYSQDSAAMLDAYDSALRNGRNGRRWPKGQREKRETSMSFLRRVADMGLRPT